MNVVCLGGGPGGLYFSILIKKNNPSWKVTVVERNRPDSTFGWGVVFSDKTISGLQQADPESYAAIDLHFDGTEWRLSGIELPKPIARTLAASLPVK